MFFFLFFFLLNFLCVYIFVFVSRSLFWVRPTTSRIKRQMKKKNNIFSNKMLLDFGYNKEKTEWQGKKWEISLYPMVYIFRWRSIVLVEFVEWSWRSKTTTSTTRTEIVRLEVRWNGLRCCGTEMLRGWWWRWAVMLWTVTNRMICPRRRWIGSSQSVNIYE